MHDTFGRHLAWTSETASIHVASPATYEVIINIHTVSHKVLKFLIGPTEILQINTTYQYLLGGGDGALVTAVQHTMTSAIQG